MSTLESVLATRYITPLREGGSLPAVVDANNGTQYVVKFFGAGQGPKALIAELIGGEIARAIGLRVPELAFVEVDPLLGRSESDPEIKDLLDGSVGVNLGLRFLPHALNFDPLADEITGELASQIIWLDAFITNVDRTARNVNMLMHNEALWLIDHGAALYFHHSWKDYQKRIASPFAMIRQHVLLKYASDLPAADAKIRALLDDDQIAQIVAQIPDAWLNDDFFDSPAANRAAYIEYLTGRLAEAHNFVEEAVRAHLRA